MIISFIKFYSILLTSTYLYDRLLNIDIAISKCKVFLCITALSVFITLSRVYTHPFTVIFSFFLFYFFTILTFHIEPRFNFVLSLIAYGLSYAFLDISVIIFGFIIFPFFQSGSYPPDIITFLSAGTISFLLAHLPFRLKKFQNGMKHLYHSQLINVISAICLFILVILTIMQHTSLPESLAAAFPCYILAAAVLFFFIWQHQIKRYYTAKLRKLELESLRQELEEKEAMIQKLTDSNEELARIIHRDNKLIPAALNAVTEYLQSAENSTIPEQKKHGEALCAQLQELANDRMGILTASARADQTIPLTGYAAVDAMLSYMQKRADSERITYEVKLHPDFASKIGKEISETDLSHLLSDLIENAIIATRKTEHKHVCVHLGILYDAPAVEVSDSGIPFAPEVYQDFGLQKHSTHLDEGGSGIGLMDIWELKKKYAASLHIYEYMPETTLFTKKISLVFDHRKHYLIRSCRPEEIIKLQARSDLYILPLQDKTP